MRAGALVIISGLLLAFVTGETILSHSPTREFGTPVVAACSAQGERCPQPSSLDGSGQLILSHNVLVGGCPDADLHVLRYVPAGEETPRPVAASWCN